MNYPAASYGVSKDNMFCHSVLDTESRKTGFPLPDRVEDKLRGNDRNEASFGEFNPTTHENLCNLRNLWIKKVYKMQKVKPDDRKYLLLAEKIEQIFREGFVLSDDITHYIDSTFSNPSINELEEIINDEHNCERDSLIELLFFPDESMQIKLEEFLESEDFKKEDEEKPLNYILNKKLKTEIHLPEGKGSLKFFVPELSAAQFVFRLNISKKLNKKLLKAIDKFVTEKCKISVKVRLRNTRSEFSENKIKFLCSFFEKIKVEENYFFNCLDFILDFFDRLKDDRNILQFLLDKKELYFQDLQKAVKFEELLNKNNIETLISRGVRIPHISKEDAMNKIVIIDTIILAVYGKQYYSQL